MTEIETRFEELSADLAANRKELSSKTKQLVELQNQLSSMKAELNNKDKQLDEMRISSQIASDGRVDEMHLQMEEYKNQIHAKESEKQELHSRNMELQRQNQHMKSQLDSLSFKYQHNQNEFNLRLSRLDAMYKQKLESMTKTHQQQIELYQKKIEAVKQEQFLMSNKETEDIVNSLNELRASHDQIESDLNAQIEDLKDQMEKREREKEQLIEEMRALSDQSKTHFEARIQELTEKLARFEEGDVEIVLKIEVDDPVLHKPPPKKPAPSRPQHMMQQSQPVPMPHSRNSSAASASSNNSYNPSTALLSPADSNSNNNNFHLTLQNIRSNPEFWGIDHSNPNAPHHQPQKNSAIGIIKSMWGTTPKPQTPNINRRWRGMSSARSVGGYPATPQPNGHGLSRPKKRNASVTSFNSDLFAFSDNLSVTSSGYGDQPSPGHGSQPSGGNISVSESDLANKSLTLQLEMHKQASTRLAEDLKNANKKVMVIKQQAHRKIKQISLQLQAEQRKWKIREKEMGDKLEKKSQDIKKNELMIGELQRKFQALRTEYSMKLQQQSNNPQNPQNPQAAPQNNANVAALMSKVQSLESNNAGLAQENDKYRRDLHGLKQTILSCNDTMKQQQQQILVLNTQLAELRKLNGFGASSSEELLQKQIRLLKSQRRMLVKELKDLREQNDKLKNIIVTGATPSSIKPYNM